MSAFSTNNKNTTMREEMPFLLEKPPAASSRNVAKAMRAIKTKNTKPELLIRRALWSSGIKGYRNNPKTIPGRPDICFVGKKIAIFVNGCFWHRCPHCALALPKTNTDFWRKKFERNILRDELKIGRLKSAGWKVITLWECEINSEINACVEKIKDFVFSNDLQQ